MNEAAMTTQALMALITGFPWASLITAISTLTAVWITSYLTERRAAGERLWNIRREAYGEVVAALTEALAETDAILHIIEHVAPRYWPDEAVVAAVGRWSEQAAVARRHVAKNRMVLTPDFVAAYDRFGSSMKRLDRDTQLSAERFKAARLLIDETRNELERLARLALEP